MPVVADRSRPFDTAKTSNLAGIGIAVIGWCALVCMDAGSKILASSYPVVQILWFRYVLLIAVAFILMKRQKRSLRVGRPSLQFARGLLLVFEIGLVIYAFSRMGLADVHAILAITPLLVTALSVPLLGERVGVRRWAAVGMACIGMLIILRPGFGVLQPTTLIVLLAAFMFAIYLVLTRLVSRTDPPEASLFWIALVGSIGLSAIIPFFWHWPADATDWALFGVVSLLGMTGHFCLIKSLQLAEASVLQPYSYLAIVGAVLIGYAVFDDLPDVPTIVGATIIVASGLYVLARERKLRNRAGIARDV